MFEEMGFVVMIMVMGIFQLGLQKSDWSFGLD